MDSSKELFSQMRFWFARDDDGAAAVQTPTVSPSSLSRSSLLNAYHPPATLNLTLIESATWDPEIDFINAQLCLSIIGALFLVFSVFLCAGVSHRRPTTAQQASVANSFGLMDFIKSSRGSLKTTGTKMTPKMAPKLASSPSPMPKVRSAKPAFADRRNRNKKLSTASVVVPTVDLWA